MQFNMVSKLFRAYRLYNGIKNGVKSVGSWGFQSSFELTGYITVQPKAFMGLDAKFQSSFELTGYITTYRIY